MSRPTRNTMIREFQKAFRAGSRLKPLHCGKSCRGAVPIRNPMPGVHFQFASYAQKERECNCLRGQVNGHNATLYFTCPPPIWAPILANEFCRIFSIPRFIFACTLSGAIVRVILVQARRGLGPEFFGGSKQDAWIGIWIVIRAECGHCGTFLCLQ
jgi:hypothetical protein